MPALLGLVAGGIRDIVFGLMLDDSFTHFPSQIEPRKVWIAALQFGDDPQRLAVVVEPAVGCHQPAEGCFAGMPEGWVAQVVGQ